MEEQKRIRPTRVFLMIVFDIVLLAVFMAAFLPAHLKILAAAYLPLTLVINVAFLRSSRGKTAKAPAASGVNGARSGKSSLYMCSGIFFIGTLYGLLTIIEGELQRTFLPLLLVPLSIAIYCWRMARRVAAQGSTRDDTRLNRPANR